MEWSIWRMCQTKAATKNAVFVQWLSERGMAEENRRLLGAANKCRRWPPYSVPCSTVPLQNNGTSLDKMLDSYGFFASLLATRCTKQIIDVRKVNNNLQGFEGIKFIQGHWQWFLWEEIVLRERNQKKLISAGGTLWMSRRHYKGLLQPLRCQLMPFLAWFSEFTARTKTCIITSL